MLMSLTQPIRVLLIDDHVMVRAGIRMLLESQETLAVVGEASTCSEALALAVHTQPDIILLDLDLGGTSVVEMIPALQNAAIYARIIILTGLRDPEVHQQAVQLGAVGLIIKEQGSGVLLQAIDRVHAGEVWIERVMMANILRRRACPEATSDPAAARNATLSRREREVINLLGEGLRNKDIAERLSISETTVRHHLSAVYSKLGVSDRLELVLYAYRHGLIQPNR